MNQGMLNKTNIEQPIPLANWVADPNTWNKYTFINEASKFMWEAYGNTTEQDQHALAMLAEVLETFVICCKDIAKNGLVIIHSNGVTGKNHHVEIRDKTIARSVLLMNELGLTPKGRFPLKPTSSDQVQKFLQGPKGIKVNNVIGVSA